MNPFKRSAQGLFASQSLLGHLLRGCPICWMIGLVETVMQKIRLGAAPL